MKWFVFAVFSTALIAAEMPLTDWEFVEPGASNRVLGPTGGAGDVIGNVLVTIHSDGTGATHVKDGSTLITVTPSTAPAGTYSVFLNARSTAGAWSATTGAGASLFATGRFK